VDIRLPEKTPTVVRLLTPAEVLTLASAMPDRYALLVLLGASTGLRQGEAFGLTLDRVNADDGMLTVDQQVIVANRRPILAPPKTLASVRDVPMPVFVQAHREVRTRREGRDAPYSPAAPAAPRLLQPPHLEPAIKAAGLMADTTFHDLRHTFASTALAEGVPISEVSHWLGHKSITTTVDLYGHLVPEASARARTALDGAFSVARTTARTVHRTGACESACRPGIRQAGY
jgi:integrase